MHNNEIKFIYFDVGNVLVFDLLAKPEKWQQFITDLNFPIHLERSFIRMFERFDSRFNLGKKVEDEFIDAVQKELGYKFPPDYSLLDDLIPRFEANKSLWSSLDDLKHNYQLGLLTNMWRGMLNSIRQHHLLPEIDWSIIIDSSVVNMEKPKREIYSLAQNQACFKGKEILFIDNLDKNLEIPRQMGWHTLHYNFTNPSQSNQVLLNILSSK